MSPIFELTTWQKKQAALLYFFSSAHYLEGLRDRVRTLRFFADGILNTDRVQLRDKVLKSKRWGNRDTVQNWQNNAWPFLGDFEQSIDKSIIDQRSNTYHRTGAYHCARGMSEVSMQWMAPEEQGRFDRMFEEASKYARYIDDTMDRTAHATRWCDFGLTMAWRNHMDQVEVLPKLRARSDLVAESGQLPPRTGVYISTDDPAAALQFAWTGSSEGKLLDCTTFNDTGKAALATVGRAGMWTDGNAMLRIVLDNLSNPDFTNDPFFEESQTPDLAPSLVARNAFTSHSARWCYVELIEDEFEPY